LNYLSGFSRALSSASARTPLSANKAVKRPTPGSDVKSSASEQGKEKQAKLSDSSPKSLSSSTSSLPGSDHSSSLNKSNSGLKVPEHKKLRPPEPSTKPGSTGLKPAGLKPFIPKHKSGLHSGSKKSTTASTGIRPAVNVGSGSKPGSSNSSAGASSSLGTPAPKSKPASTAAPTPVSKGPSAFALYSRSEKRAYAEAHPEMESADVRKALFEQWKQLSDIDKAPFIKQEKEMREAAEKQAANVSPKSNSPNKSKIAPKSEPEGGQAAGAGKKKGSMMDFVQKKVGPTLVKPRTMEEEAEMKKRKEEEQERMRLKLMSKEEKEKKKEKEKETRRLEREQAREKQKEERRIKKEQEKEQAKLERERNKPRDDDELVEENASKPLPVPEPLVWSEHMNSEATADIVMLVEFFKTFGSALPSLESELNRLFKGYSPTHAQLEQMILNRRTSPDWSQVLACMVLIVQENDQGEYLRAGEVKEKSVFALELATLPVNEFTASEVLRMYLERMRDRYPDPKTVGFVSENDESEAASPTGDVINQILQYDARALPLAETLALLKFLCNECLLDNTFVNEHIRLAPEKISQCNRDLREIESRTKDLEKEREDANAAASKSGVDIDADAEFAMRMMQEERRERRATRTVTESSFDKELREKKEAEAKREEEEEEMAEQADDHTMTLMVQENRIRSRMLGLDRNRSTYFMLTGSQGLFVQSATGELAVYQKASALDELLGQLNDRGLRELNLKANLKKEYEQLERGLTSAQRKQQQRGRLGSIPAMELKEEPAAADDVGGGGHGDGDSGGGEEGGGGAENSEPVSMDGDVAVKDDVSAVVGAVVDTVVDSEADVKPDSMEVEVETQTVVKVEAEVNVESDAGMPTLATPVPVPRTDDASPHAVSPGYVFVETFESPEKVECRLLQGCKENILVFNQDVCDGSFGRAYSSDFESTVKEAQTAKQLADQLVELEQDLELKFMKPPLGPKKELQGDDGGTETVYVGRWREYADTVSNTSQLNLLYELLWTSIRWEKSSKNAKCKVCRKTTDSDRMLMCDSCDTGYHTYCCFPKLYEIPEGDWLCRSCNPTELTSRQTRQKTISYKDHDSEPEDDDEEDDLDLDVDYDDSDSDDGAYDKEDDDEEAIGTKRKSEVFASSTRGGQGEADMKKCLTIWKALRDHDGAFWFEKPIGPTDVPEDYFDIIKEPMDLTTIKARMDGTSKDGLIYEDKDAFAADVRLIFSNCASYNPDNTAVAEDGLKVSKLFEKKFQRSFAQKESNAKKSKSRR
jgi:hypothetical protein